jgi:hypothetical protein
METVLLLRQCPPGIAQNFDVTIRDMSAALVEKHHELLVRANAAPLELPPPLPQPIATTRVGSTSKMPQGVDVKKVD